MKRSRPVSTAVLMALAAGAVFSVLAMATEPQPAQSHRRTKCELFTSVSRDRDRIATGSGRSVVVIGDSYSVGLGLVHPLAAWPARLPGRVHVFGFSGSGFSRFDSNCGDVAYYQRAPAAMRDKPSLVVVEGGLNDFDRSAADIRFGFKRLLAAIGHRRVLVVGPPPAPSRLPGAIVVDALLRRLTARSGVAYLSMIDRAFSYLPDKLHLTAASHQAFGAYVATAVRALEHKGAAKHRKRSR